MVLKKEGTFLGNKQVVHYLHVPVIRNMPTLASVIHNQQGFKAWDAPRF